METTALHIAPSVKPYWNKLKALPNEEKKQLITLLISTMPHEEAKPETSWLDKVCGAWQGPETAEEIIENIRWGRSHPQRELASFDD